jgi:hypothetical protein
MTNNENKQGSAGAAAPTRDAQVSGYTRNEKWIQNTLDQHTKAIDALQERVVRAETLLGVTTQPNGGGRATDAAANAMWKISDAVRGKDPLDSLREHANVNNPAFWAAYQASLRAKVLLSVLVMVAMTATAVIVIFML